MLDGELIQKPGQPGLRQLLAGRRLSKARQVDGKRPIISFSGRPAWKASFLLALVPGLPWLRSTPLVDESGVPVIEQPGKQRTQQLLVVLPSSHRCPEDRLATWTALAVLTGRFVWPRGTRERAGNVAIVGATDDSLDGFLSGWAGTLAAPPFRRVYCFLSSRCLPQNVVSDGRRPGAR